jgi:hypothetical protein
MKTLFKYFIIASVIASGILILPACSKSKKDKKAVVTNATALSALEKLEAAINARVGIYNIVGTVDVTIYSNLDNKQVSITKLTPSRIRIAPINFSMGTFEFDVQNGATVSAGVVSGSDDGKAIGYTGVSPNGNITFSCDENDNMALIVLGSGINSVIISGNK